VIEEERMGAERPVEAQAGERKRGRFARGYRLALVAARTLWCRFAVSAFIIVFLYQPVRVEGTSMLPVLEDQDRLFINKIAYRVGEIHAGTWWSSSIRATREELHQAGDRACRETGSDRPGTGGCERQASDGAVSAEPIRRRPFAAGDGAAARRVLRDGRPQVDLQRQPRLWAGGPWP